MDALLSILRNNAMRVLTVALVAQAVLFYSASHGEATPLAAPLSNFPPIFGQWTLAQEGVVEPETLEVLKADDTLTRWYTTGTPEQPDKPVAGANLFIAYFKTQRTGQSPHSPKNCLPGSGWQPSESGKIDVDVKGQTININRYLVSKGDNQSLVMYWYQSQGRVIADEFAAKYFLVRDSIAKHRSDTALVRVTVPVAPGRQAEAEKTALDFVKSVYPVVKGYLPQ